MIPQPPEFFDLFSTDHRRREAVAAAERLRGPGGLRTRSRLDSAGDGRPHCPSVRPSADGERAGPA